MNNELTAALLTIEKSKEESGCPAGVDLQDWVRQLTAENLGLKASIPPLKMINDVTDSWDDVSLAEEVGFNLAISAIMKNIPDTPATDRIVAGIKADGVESGIKTIMTMLNHQAPGVSDAINVLRVHSSELREGGDK
ncbi:hypothetical protein ACU6ZK_02215 [Klebsiella aerogenes]